MAHKKLIASYDFKHLYIITGSSGSLLKLSTRIPEEQGTPKLVNQSSFVRNLML
jgi:hypothetical protein